jgi:hypothetical protein
MRKNVCTEMNIYLYLNNNLDRDIIEKVKYLKDKRKLNSIVMKLLREYIEEESEQFELFEKEKQS